MSDLDINTTEGQRRFDAIAHEIGAIFDREHLDPDVATSILLDCAARVYAKDLPSQQARRDVARAAAEMLEQMTEHYAGGGK